MNPNGCGPAPIEKLIPDWIFLDACEIHDIDYEIGGTEEERKAADRQFYSNMLRKVSSESSWWNYHFYKSLAWIYWKAVMAGGKLVWNYK